MKVLYLDQYFSTREGISGTRSYEFARLLVRWGHEVTVVCAATDYAGKTPQRRFLKRTTVEGIRVWSLRIGYSSEMGYARRVLSFAAFMVFGTLTALLVPRADVVFATSTPLTIGVPGVLVSWLRGGRFVFEVRDLWPEAPVQLGVISNPILIRLLRGLERFFYRRARHVVALSPGMAEGVVAQGIDEDRVSVIPNACDLDLTDAAEPATEELARLGLDGRFVCLYAGAIGPANDLDYLVDVAAEVAKIGADPVHFLVIGTGPRAASVRARAESLGLSNVTFVDPVPRQAVPGYVKCAQATLTLFADTPILATNSPNKLFDYLAAGRPALVNSPGWTRRLVEDAGAGIFLPRDPAEAARRIVALSADPERVRRMGENARRLAEERFERGKLARELEAVFDDVVAKSPVQGAWGATVKRAIDVLGSLAALALLSPVFAAVAWRIRRDSPGPVFFSQTRAGPGGRLFSVWKFRTMTDGAASAGLGLNVAEGDPRITKVGAFLREWSLDELPQIINVLTGEMSLIGPRPALPEQAERYTSAQRRRLLVRPGITGWAQVNGRNALTWAERIALDTEYVDRLSLALDLRILARTLGVVISREGLYEPDGGLDDDLNRFEDRP